MGFMDNLTVEIPFLRNAIRRQCLLRDVTEIIEALQQALNLSPCLRQWPAHLRSYFRRDGLAVFLKITERSAHKLCPLDEGHPAPSAKSLLCPRGGAHQPGKILLLPFTNGIARERINGPYIRHRCPGLLQKRHSPATPFASA